MTGPLDGRLTEIAGVPPKGPLRNSAVCRPIEGNAHVFQFVNGPRGISGQNFGGILVRKVIPPFDRIVHVPFPRIRFFVSQRGGDSALGCAGVGPGGVDFADQGHIGRRGYLHRRPQPGEPGAHDHDVMLKDHRLSPSSPRLEGLIRASREAAVMSHVLSFGPV